MIALAGKTTKEKGQRLCDDSDERMFRKLTRKQLTGGMRPTSFSPCLIELFTFSLIYSIIHTSAVMEVTGLDGRPLRLYNLAMLIIS